MSRFNKMDLNVLPQAEFWRLGKEFSGYVEPVFSKPRLASAIECVGYRRQCPALSIPETH